MLYNNGNTATINNVTIAPTVETDLMELDMYFVGTPWGKVFFRLKRISEALLDNSFWAVSFNSPDPFQWFFAHEIL